MEEGFGRRGQGERFKDATLLEEGATSPGMQVILRSWKRQGN